MQPDMPEHSSTKLVYDSAVDWWVATLLMLAPLTSVVAGVFALMHNQFDAAMILFLCGAFTIVVTILVTLPCRYTLLDDTLNIRCGILCYSIPLDKIENVKQSSSWLSGPALSLRRVCVTAGGKHYLVSPKNRDGFIEELIKRRDAALKTI